MTSSSGDSAAPLDFRTSSNSGDDLDTDRLDELPTRDCPLCTKAHRAFYCKTCVSAGDFYHSGSASKFSDRFADKRLKLIQYRQEKNKAQQAIEAKLSPHLRVARLESDIKGSSERIRFLKFILQDKAKVILEKKEKVKTLKAYNEDKKARLPRYEDRVGKLKGYVRNKANTLREKEATLSTKREDLKRIRRTNIHQLVHYIFPISLVRPSQSDDIETDEEDSETVSALEEACQTAYVQGRWVMTNTGISAELQHRIVAPTLPSSGDYSAYCDWVAANKDGVPATANHQPHENPAYNISAALTYTAQLVNMIAFFLDIRLPSKLCYGEFCTTDLSKDKFSKRVARLNWNVLHLCLSQNVLPSLLRPQNTLANVLHLLDAPDLGRSGASDVDPVAARALEEALRPSLDVPSESEDSEDDSENLLSYEWESVASTGGIPEAEPGPAANLTSQQQLSTTSVAGGLITSTAASIASLWRGWATNR